MRVLQVHNHYRDAGGEDVVVAAEAALLREGGHEVVEHRAENPVTTGRAAVALATSAWNSRAAARVREVARRLRPDVAHVHNTWFSLTPAVVAGLAAEGVPVVMTLHNYRLLCANALLFRDGHPCQDCVGRRPWPGVVHRCYRGSAGVSVLAAGSIAVHQQLSTWQRHVDAFIVMTEAGRRVFVDGGFPRDRLHVKPHSIADPTPRSHAPSASSTVLYVGRLTPGKGAETLLAAWASRDRPGQTLRILGDGPLRAELERRYGTVATFLGARPVDEVYADMRGARALAFSSQSLEPFGLVLVEAMANGLPIVASDLPSTREILGGAAHPSLLVTPNDVDALAGALTRLTDDALVDQVGTDGRARYEREYTPDRNRDRLVGLYERVMR